MSLAKQAENINKTNPAIKHSSDPRQDLFGQSVEQTAILPLIRRSLQNPVTLSSANGARLQRTLGNQMLGHIAYSRGSHSSAAVILQQVATPAIQRHPPPPEHFHPHPPPRLLNASPNLGMFSGSELEDELVRIDDWFSRNPESSETRNHLLQTQRMLWQTLNQRRNSLNHTTQNFPRSIPTWRELPVNPVDAFASRFAKGFVATAAFEIRPDNWHILERELQEHWLKFYAGFEVGELVGVGKQFADNVLALVELLALSLAVQPSNLPFTIPLAWHNRQKFVDAYRQALAIMSTIKSVLKEPGFAGEQLGEVAGLAAGEWFNNSFMQMSTFEKGMAVGDVVGRALIEVLLLFVGVEEIAIKGAMAIVRSEKVMAKLEKIIAPLAKRSPALQKLIEEARNIRKAQQAARDAIKGRQAARDMVKARQNVEHGADSAHTGANESKSVDPWEELGKELNTKRRGEGVAHPSPTRNLPDEIYLPPTDYHQALRGAHIERFFDDVTKAIDQVGYETAEFVVSKEFKYHDKFIQACRKGNWANAGNYFHIAAAQKGKAMNHLLPKGYTFEFEKTLIAGKGGSRYDIFVRTPKGELLEFDWKTTGRSAISSIPQMERHAKQTLNKFNQGLSRQESISWTEFVRPILKKMNITNIKWP